MSHPHILLLHLEVVRGNASRLLVLSCPISIRSTFGLFERCLMVVRLFTQMLRLWITLSMYIISSLLRSILLVTVLVVLLPSFLVRKGTTSHATQATSIAKACILLLI